MRAGNKRKSLMTTFAVAFFLFSVCVLLISNGLEVLFDINSQQEVLAGNLHSTAQDAASTVGDFVQEKLKTLKIIDWFYNPDTGSRRELLRILQSILGLEPSFRRLVALDPRGKRLVAVSRLSHLSTGSVDRFEQEMKIASIATANSISSIYFDNVTAEPLIVMAVPCTNALGDVKGRLVAEVNLKFMWDTVERLAVGKTGYAYVVDRLGNLIAFHDTARVLKGENVIKVKNVSEFARSPESVQKEKVSMYEGIMGTTVVGAYVPLGMPDWAVVTELPAGEAFKDVVRETLVTGLVTLIIGVLAGLAGIWAARRLAVPLVRLTDIAMRIANGESAQAPVGGPKEIASLSEAFNSMTTQLTQSLENLERQNVQVRRAEESMRESEQKYRTVIENIQDVFFRVDLSGNILMTSPSATVLFEYESVNQMIGLPFDSLWPDPREAGRLFDEIKVRGSVKDFEALLKKKDGSAFFASFTAHHCYDEYGRVIGNEGIIRDITERKQNDDIMRLRLKLMEYAGAHTLAELLQKSLDEVGDLTHSPIGFCHFLEADQKTITLQAWSTQTLARFCTAQGKGAHYPIDKAGVWTDCVHERRPVIHNDFKSLAHRKGFPEGHADVIRELVVPVMRGERIVAILGVGNKPQLYTERDAEIVAYLADIIWEIAERKKAEEEKERLQAQLLQVHKMEAVGRLAGGVAHDFNNTLSVIIGYAELAKARLDRHDSLYFDLDEIFKAALRSADLTRQLLAFSRKQIIEPKVVNVNTIISDSENMLRRLVGEDIRCNFLSQAVWPVKMDPSQIDQILANLAVNARDAMPEGGVLTILTENRTLNELYCQEHKGSAPGDYVMIVVSDTGHGIENDVLVHIFEPFYTTKRNGEGTGLGLSTVYGIVNQNNGFINVESEINQGTTFEIFLPRYPGDLEPDAGRTASIPVMGSETILMVEDEEQILSVTELFLKKHGYTVMTAAHPEQALAFCKNHPGEIHLLITDVIMPAMNGKELKEEIEKIKPGIKVLYMSGYTADIIVPRGILTEGVAFIQKPFLMDDFLDKVRQVLKE